jgi:hypothetical protein
VIRREGENELLMVHRASRALGSTIGLYMNYGWMWYHWREAHE